MYIYQRRQWPEFTWKRDTIEPLLIEVKINQAKLLGKMQHLRFDIQTQATLNVLTSDVIKSAEIEGEKLDLNQVRSSIARHLGIEIAGYVTPERHIDGIVEMLLDATQHFQKPLTEKRLCQWNNLLFPSALSGMQLINPGFLRNDAEGPMQVVSGSYGREKIHFRAPAAKILTKELNNFIKWFNQKFEPDLLIKAAIAHLWFVTLHTFDDGNGRMARAITDMALAKAENNAHRFYSMSTQIRSERKSYYDMLEKTQKSGVDITSWIHWFLTCLDNAINNSDKILDRVLNKSRFWQKHHDKQLNERQIKMLNVCFDGLKGKLNSSRWAKMTKCSQDTATRDIQKLIELEILIKSEQSGRSQHYLLKEFAINYIN